MKVAKDIKDISHRFINLIDIPLRCGKIYSKNACQPAFAVKFPVNILTSKKNGHRKIVKWPLGKGELAVRNKSGASVQST